MNGDRSPKRVAPIFRRNKIDMLKDFLEGKSLGHPIHPMLVHFPIGLFFLSLLLDIASFVFPNVPNLVLASFYAISLGLIAALVAAVPGFADYTDIRRDHPAKRIATAHMTLNLIVVTFYGINLAVRTEVAQVQPLPLELAGTTVTIQGILSSILNKTFTLEFFVSPAGNPQSPANPPTSEMTSGIRVGLASRAMRSTSASPASMSTPAWR